MSERRVLCFQTALWFKKRNISATIVANVRRFGRQINTDGVFGTHRYLLGSLLMLAAALVALRWAVAAECKPLESVAKPLASIE
jgi:hypothetical protein